MSQPAEVVVEPGCRSCRVSGEGTPQDLCPGLCQDVSFLRKYPLVQTLLMAVSMNTLKCLVLLIKLNKHKKVVRFHIFSNIIYGSELTNQNKIQGEGTGPPDQRDQTSFTALVKYSISVLKH